MSLSMSTRKTDSTSALLPISVRISSFLYVGNSFIKVFCDIAILVCIRTANNIEFFL